MKYLPIVAFLFFFLFVGAALLFVGFQVRGIDPSFFGRTISFFTGHTQFPLRELVLEEKKERASPEATSSAPTAKPQSVGRVLASPKLIPPSVKVKPQLSPFPSPPTPSGGGSGGSAPETFTYYVKATAYVYSCSQTTCDGLGYLKTGKEVTLPSPINFQEEWVKLKISTQDQSSTSTDGFVPSKFFQTAPPLISSNPPLSESVLSQSVVLIECSYPGGKIIGSGVAMEKGLVLTAAHVLYDAAGTECNVVFPDDTGKARYYFKSDILDKDALIKRYRTEGLDIGFLRLGPLTSSTPFSAYPFLSAKECGSDTLYDQTLHLGYAGSITAQGGLRPLVREVGGIVIYGEVSGVEGVVNQSGKVNYQPELTYSRDALISHPYTLDQVANLYQGSSGGLVLDSTRQCILGLTISAGTGSDGKVYSEFINLSYPGVEAAIEGVK